MGFEKLNLYGKLKTPCLFITDFLGENCEVYPLDTLEQNNIAYSIEEDYIYKEHQHSLAKKAVDFERYTQKFAAVIENIKAGNTYILNLTQPTVTSSELSLKQIFVNANAQYKLRYKEKFVCFSPETFIRIEGDTIATFPMKGTIDASCPNAKQKILSSTKEMAEHVMIVDLLRNDLSIVAKDVKVERFRYVQKIAAGDKQLLQVSSHISGKLRSNWQESLGDILKALLPAGSISGAPKKSTVELIQNIEGYDRGYFSGVFGVFDGEKVDSGVMIRFIEKTEDGYLYKSGGGITLDSDARSEYEEMIDKVYLP